MAPSSGRCRGKTPSLLVLVEQYTEEIEADLHEVYRVDILDLWRFRLSPRKVLNLVRRLPSQSHTVTAIRNSLTPEQLAEAQKTGDPSRARWSDEGMLIAAVKDELAFLRHQHLVANGAKNVKDPEPMVRPGVNRSQAKGITTAQAKYLNDLRETHRANQERARAEAPEAHTDDETEAP